MNSFCRTLWNKELIMKIVSNQTVDRPSWKKKNTMEVNEVRQLSGYGRSSQYLPLCLAERILYRFGTICKLFQKRVQILLHKKDMAVNIAWLNASIRSTLALRSTLFVLERLCAPSPGPALRASIISLLFASPPSLVCLFRVRWPWSRDKRGIWQTGTLWASIKRQRSICPNTRRKAYVLYAGLLILDKNLYRWV